MFSYHNKIKRSLYERYTFPGETLVELGCGKGGDLHKATFSKTAHLVCVDVDRTHLEEAAKRYEVKRTQQEQVPETKFLCLDLTEEKSWHQIELDKSSVQCVSTQFFLQYLWGKKRHMEQCLRWMQYVLELGGFWIGTVPDGDAILWLCGDKMHHKNALVDIVVNRACADQKANDFGNSVTFQLRDSIIGGPGGSKEYLVFWKCLVDLASRFGFHLVASSIFQDNTELSGDERQITVLNRWFVFQKVQQAVEKKHG